MRKLGIIGFGSFGQFMALHLKEYFEVFVTNRSDKQLEAKEIGVKFTSIENVAEKEIIILSVPVQYLEETLVQIRSIVRPGSLIIDVSSVKVTPIQLMKKYLPKEVEIIGTHPLFGPQSGKKGVEGLNCVLCHENTKSSSRVRYFLEETLRLNILERSAETHDKQMAYVQALTHFVGRAVNEMDIPDVDQKTDAYQYLLNIKRNLGKDSWDLFKTIEEQNPFAKQVREHFLKELEKLHSQLS